jgi:peptidoglycan/LPS O-acetylase OafA/YrhL
MLLVNQYGEVPAVRVFSAGIVVFFIISGYIIARSTEKTSDPLLFFVRRFLRIYPVWWAALAMWLLGEQLILDQTATVSQVALSGALVFFWNDQYQAYVPSYHIGWTLCYEMTFYAIWCASLALARRIRVEPTFLAGAFIIALVATAAILSRTTPAAHWMKPYGTPLMLDFLAGVAIRWIEKRDLLNFRTELGATRICCLMRSECIVRLRSRRIWRAALLVCSHSFSAPVYGFSSRQLRQRFSRQSSGAVSR